MCRSNTGLARLILASVLMTASTAVSALQANGSIGLDARYTDNVALAPTNESDDLITTARASANVTESEGPLTGDASAVLRYLDYMDNSFGNQTYFSLDSNARLSQLNNRLVWSVSDYFTQTSIDNLASNTPDNSQDTNAFNLSVTSIIPVADRHRISVTPSFSDFYYDSSPNDNQQLGIAASWAYDLDPAISLSLNGSFRDVDYEDDTSSPDNENISMNIAMAVSRARSQYNVSLGATKVKRDLGGDTDGTTGTISWRYDFTGRSSLFVRASSDITDTSYAFLSSSIDPNTGSIGNIQTSSDVVRNSVFRIAYDRTGSDVNASIWTELRDLDYEVLMLDREVQEVGADISYRFTSQVTGSVRGSYIRTEDATNDYEVALLGGMLNYRLSRKLTASVGMQLQTKDSTDPVTEYDALSVSAGIGYRLGR